MVVCTSNGKLFNIYPKNNAAAHTFSAIIAPRDVARTLPNHHKIFVHVRSLHSSRQRDKILAMHLALNNGRTRLKRLNGRAAGQGARLNTIRLSFR
jgi:hypothetical protein